MPQIATRKADIEKLQRLIKNRKRIEALRAQIKELEEASEADEEFLKRRHADGIALARSRTRATIVEFTTFERQCVNMDAVRKLLKNKLPTRTVPVTRLIISEGVIE